MAARVLARWEVEQRRLSRPFSTRMTLRAASILLQEREQEREQGMERKAGLRQVRVGLSRPFSTRMTFRAASILLQ
jgi:hypothetical protein